MTTVIKRIKELRQHMKEFTLSKTEQWQYTIITGLILILTGWLNYKFTMAGANLFIVFVVVLYFAFFIMSKRFLAQSQKELEIDFSGEEMSKSISIAIENEEDIDIENENNTDIVEWTPARLRVIFIYRTYYITGIMAILVAVLHLVLYGQFPDIHTSIFNAVIVAILNGVLVGMLNFFVDSIKKYSNTVEDEE